MQMYSIPFLVFIVHNNQLQVNFLNSNLQVQLVVLHNKTTLKNNALIYEFKWRSR